MKMWKMVATAHWKNTYLLETRHLFVSNVVNVQFVDQSRTLKSNCFVQKAVSIQLFVEIKK